MPRSVPYGSHHRRHHAGRWQSKTNWQEAQGGIRQLRKFGLTTTVIDLAGLVTNLTGKTNQSIEMPLDDPNEHDVVYPTTPLPCLTNKQTLERSLQPKIDTLRLTKHRAQQLDPKRFTGTTNRSSSTPYQPSDTNQTPTQRTIRKLVMNEQSKPRTGREQRQNPKLGGSQCPSKISPRRWLGASDHWRGWGNEQHDVQQVRWAESLRPGNRTHKRITTKDRLDMSTIGEFPSGLSRTSNPGSATTHVPPKRRPTDARSRPMLESTDTIRLSSKRHASLVKFADAKHQQPSKNMYIPWCLTIAIYCSFVVMDSFLWLNMMVLLMKEPSRPNIHMRSCF